MIHNIAFTHTEIYKTTRSNIFSMKVQQSSDSTGLCTVCKWAMQWLPTGVKTLVYVSLVGYRSVRKIKHLIMEKNVKSLIHALIMMMHYAQMQFIYTLSPPGCWVLAASKLISYQNRKISHLWWDFLKLRLVTLILGHLATRNQRPTIGDKML